MKQREVQADGVSPLSGVAPPAEYRWQPGQSGNPAGRKTAGASIREQVNALAESQATEAELRKIARDDSQPWARRTAAERMIRTLESGDLADFQSLLDGKINIEQLRGKGVRTDVIRKVKQRTRTLEDGSTETTREIELHDRAGADFDRICDRTDGKPKQAIETTQHVPTVAEGIERADALLAHLREVLGPPSPTD